VAIIEAKNGKEAVEKYQEHHIDFIFMDIQMPEKNGYEATIEIREIEKNNGNKVPIVAMTAGILKGERDKCISIGMNDYLSKPIIKKSVANMINQYLLQENTEIQATITTASLVHFNQEELNQKLDNDAVVMSELLNMSGAFFDSSLIEFRLAIDTQSFANVKNTSHKIKGVALNCCFEILVSIIERIESCNVFEIEKMEEFYELMKSEINLLKKLIL
jgi:CheY-like chemotaxis protein/HPt (histidine-containing phosphotransfer) domain-containing protein